VPVVPKSRWKLMSSGEFVQLLSCQSQRWRTSGQ
jgi:hypothetical protein